MSNRRRLTLRVSTVCIGIAICALIILCLVGVAQSVRAQNAPSEKVLYNFASASGYSPSGVTRDSAENFYVATQVGGSNQGCSNGCGNILKLSPSGQRTVLYTFGPVGLQKDNPNPTGLSRNAKGNLYGATALGGPYMYGTVFQLTPSGMLGTLHTFAGGNDGDGPGSGVMIGPSGNLYGTTLYGGGTGCGGQGCGVIFRVTYSGSETVLYSFTGGTDGAQPEASPILDPTGNLYGTAVVGGDLSCSLNTEGTGCGTVWKLDTSGNFSVLYTFTGGTDGGLPHAGLVVDPSGNLYGDAEGGGNLSCGPPDGCGVAFEIDSAGNFTVLHAFAGGSNDGQFPVATLLRDSSGNLYGTTLYGGDQSCSLFGSAGCGVVFKLDSSGNETILHAFAGGSTDGEGPTPGAALVTDGKGILYGTTTYGGVANVGVIFAVQK
jgi:uncharacterized repeat protein (TIGR03803 family)